MNLPNFTFSQAVQVSSALCALGLFSGCQATGKLKIAGDSSPDLKLVSGQLGSQAWRQEYKKSVAAYRTQPLRNTAPDLPGGGPVAKSSYSSAKIKSPYVAMTFDDGPHPSFTPRLLDILKARNIKATFFVIGRNAKAYPQILQRMTREGHEIANHTWSHPDLTRLSTASVHQELSSCREAIVQATGIKPRLYRPPYGATNTNLKNMVKETFGYPTILWSVDPEDWKKPGVSVVASRLISNCHPGAILLAHDIHKSTIDAMPSALDRLMQKGYKFVTVSQLLEIERQAEAAQ